MTTSFNLHLPLFDSLCKPHILTNVTIISLLLPGYWDGRLDKFAAHIRSVNADVVGLQECQNANSIAEKSGYTLLATSASSNGNTILYNSALLQEVTSGIFNIPRDVSSVYVHLYLMITFLVSNLLRAYYF